MREPWTLLIALHAAGATLALVLGGYLAFLRKRKGDLLHRRVGRVWIVTMYWVAFSSFGIKELDPGHFTWIHGLSAWTVVSLTIAVVAARRHDVAGHRLWVVGTYFGLVGAGIAAVAFPSRHVPQTAVHHPWWLLGAAVGITLLAALIVRIAARQPPTGSAAAGLGCSGTMPARIASS